MKRRFSQYASRPDYIKSNRRSFDKIKIRRGFVLLQRIISKKNSTPTMSKRDLHRLTSRVLAGFSCVFLLEAILYSGYLYNQGEEARRNAQQMLTAYESAVPAQPPQQSQMPQQTAGEGVSLETAPPIITYQGYDILGKLVINKLGVELPVISYTDDEALEVSICYYSGALPGERGNMVITGHNYASGALFGNLDDLMIGDSVMFQVPGGEISEYQVYDALEIKPDDVAALDDYQGEYALTLLTCTSHGNRRLLVRCRLI